MKRFIAVISLGLGLVAGSGAALAQETINADGSNVTSTAGVNPVADAGGPTIVYGDLDPGPGTNVIGPPAEPAALPPAPGTAENVTAGSGDATALGPGNASAAPGTVTDGSSGTALLGPDGTYSVSEISPSNVTVGESGAPAPVAAPEPVAETAPAEAAPIDAAPVEAAAATAADLDADNYPDALEWDLGLDGNNPDTDADGVADGDELNIYGTAPTVFDTDGDGVSDGEELFGIFTDPLVWDDFSAGGGEGDTGSA